MENTIASLIHKYEQGKLNRRELIQSLVAVAASISAAGGAAAADSNKKVVRATYLNHVSHPVPDYAKTRDWYMDLFGMKVMLDDGKKANLAVGESLLIVKKRVSDELPGVDHICFTIADWDSDSKVRGAVEAELKRRGIAITRSSEHSFYFQDPDGLIIQIGGKDQ
jgi:catechol 2,3-dioxygenase-like lactoylglutathione lyase family enzyme